jgi:hypothetical protein
VISTVETDRFLCLLADAEGGADDVLPRMRALAAESESVAALLETDDTVAVRYALVEDTL